MSKRLVVLGDLHTGSVYSVMPGSYIRRDGNLVEPNRVQVELLERWKEMCRRWRRPDVLLCNGDIIDGYQPANQGVEVWTADLDEQIDAATILLEMLKPREAYFTRGTNYHVSTAGRRQEETLAGNFGSKLHEDIYLDFEGYVIHAAHHLSYSKVFHYRTTPLARAMLIAKLNESKTYKCDWLIRAHVHYFVQIRFGSHCAFSLPGWETRTPYTIRKSPEDVPDIGAVRLTHRGGGEMLEMELREWVPPKPPLVKSGRGG